MSSCKLCHINGDYPFLLAAGTPLKNSSNSNSNVGSNLNCFVVTILGIIATTIINNVSL
jgi:hypothetical protein